MANIIRPTQNTGEYRGGGVSLSAAQAPGRSAAALGAEISQVGRESQRSNTLGLAREVLNTRGPTTNILSMSQQLSSLVDAEGRRIFDESKRAHQSAVLLNKTTEATEAFIQASQNRYSRQTDENGNPTFMTLHKDIESIGKEIGDKIGGSIIDPEVAQAFKERFGSYVANQKLSALKKARSQQISFGRSSLDKGLGKLIHQASRDNFDQLASYEQQGLDSLKNALQGGLISHEEYDEKVQDFSNIIRFKTLQNTVKTDRVRATEVLTNESGASLGVSEEQKTQLDTMLGAGLASDLNYSIKAKEQEQIDNVTAETKIVAGIFDKIKADILREDELLEQQGVISPKSFKQLKREFVSHQKKMQKERDELFRMANKAANGGFLGEEKPSDINKLFDYMVKQQSDAIQAPVSLSEQAIIASALQVPVGDYTKRLHFAAKYADTNQAADVLGAYTYLRDKESPVLDGTGFTNEDAAILDLAETYFEKAGLQPNIALEKAREAITETTDDMRKARNTAFNKIKPFQHKNFVETAATDLDAESFFGRNLITEDAANTYRELTRQAYLQHGDIEAAKKTATHQMQRTHGPTRVGTETKYMFAPPEKVFPTVSVDTLNEILLDDVQPLLPEGYETQDITLVSDESTFTVTGQPSWLVTIPSTIAGIHVPLEDPATGQPLRWSPLGHPLLVSEEEVSPFEEARAERNRQIERGVLQTGQDFINNFSPEELEMFRAGVSRR